MKKVLYLTGSRADFGLFESTLLRLEKCHNVNLKIGITGSHLQQKLGNTITHIKEAGFQYSVIESGNEDGSRSAMAKSCALQLDGVSILLAEFKPDLLIVLGDRGEMLAAAIAALFANVPVAHIHGGERSGTIDESIRHAISKLSHYHFVSTNCSKERLIKMGEIEQNIYAVGAPGLDEVINSELPSEEDVRKYLSILPEDKYCVCVFHPVVQDAENMAKQVNIYLDSLPKDLIIILMRPNSDAGSSEINSQIDKFEATRENIRVFSHIARDYFLAILKHSEIMIGNSSAGIIEAASFKLPVVNIGERQNFRARSNNVIDVHVNTEEIKQGISDALSLNRFQIENVYGNGDAANDIAMIISNLEIDPNVTRKVNAY